MKYEILSKAPLVLIYDEPSAKIFIKRMVLDAKFSLLRKSFAWRNLVLQMASIGDDFAKDMISIRIVGNIYKIPRIIKKSHLKKYTK